MKQHIRTISVFIVLFLLSLVIPSAKAQENAGQFVETFSEAAPGDTIAVGLKNNHPKKAIHVTVEIRDWNDTTKTASTSTQVYTLAPASKFTVATNSRLRNDRSGKSLTIKGSAFK